MWVSYYITTTGFKVALCIVFGVTFVLLCMNMIKVGVCIVLGLMFPLVCIELQTEPWNLIENKSTTCGLNWREQLDKRWYLVSWIVAFVASIGVQSLITHATDDGFQHHFVILQHVYVAMQLGVNTILLSSKQKHDYTPLAQDTATTKDKTAAEYLIAQWALAMVVLIFLVTLDAIEL